MDKHYKVFISSTYEDLKAERDAILQAILRLNQFPAGMELFTARSEPPWEVITEAIDSSDYYVLVIAGRYGSVAPEGISYTEKEYNYAVNQGLRILAFIHSSPDDIAIGKSEIDDGKREQLAAFRTRVQEHTRNTWATLEELTQAVTTALAVDIITHPATGWVRANGVDNTELLKKLEQLRQQNDDLSDDNAQLEFENIQLKEAIQDKQLNAKSPKEIAAELPTELADVFLTVNNADNHTHMTLRGMLDGSREGAEFHEAVASLISMELLTDAGEHGSIVPTSKGWSVLDELRKKEIIEHFFRSSNTSENCKQLAETLRIYNEDMEKLLAWMNSTGVIESATDARENYHLTEDGVKLANELFPTGISEVVFPPQ